MSQLRSFRSNVPGGQVEEGAAHGPRAQLRQALAGKSLAEQMALVAPPRPPLMRVDARASGSAAQVQHETDPRLGYTEAAKEEGKGLDAQALPYSDPSAPEAGWDHQQILSQLTQVDEDDATTSDEVRCGANAALAIAIMAGPAGLKQFSQRLDVKAMAIMLGRGKNAKIPEERKAAVEAQYMESGEACFRIEMGSGTYADLSKIAHATKVIMSADPEGATTGHEAAAAASLGGDTEKKGVLLEDPEHLKVYCKDLKPGDALILNVDTDVYSGGQRSQDQLNHFVVVGKDPKQDEKGVYRIFLYDPYPREGTQLLRSQSPDFWTLFLNEEGKPKAVLLVSKTTAASYSSEVFPPGWDTE